MTGPVTLRPATPGDLDLLTTLNLHLREDQGYAGGADEEPWVRERLRGWLTGVGVVGGPVSLAVFERDGEPLAFASWRLDDTGVYGRQLFVSRAHRREGLGRRAIDLLRQAFPGQALSLDVLLTNEPARAFYRALGFTESSVIMSLPALGGEPAQVPVAASH
ncbi:GNAT family N-acetyltransferase [Spongisporangium articulatum]|uniref:GNAT family N-acetyltransferase n=1 Tax=Spongisporangium articulatum TaxID=3362603 RepID=A0ABW8AMK4_9ACTN